jgi:DNA-binding GntR family transcriptional regulator
LDNSHIDLKASRKNIENILTYTAVDKMKKINHPPLYIVAKEEILNYIQRHGLANGAKLPSEKELTKKLGISRGTVREAMRL